MVIKTKTSAKAQITKLLNRSRMLVSVSLSASVYIQEVYSIAQKQSIILSADQLLELKELQRQSHIITCKSYLRYIKNGDDPVYYCKRLEP